MKKNKILWIVIFIIFIIVIFVGVNIVINKNKKIDDSNNTNAIGREILPENTVQNMYTENDNAKYIKTKIDDGILYSKDGKKITADVVVGTKYFDTTINDMYMNPKSYTGKTIEIEGFYMSNLPYTFVARYSTSNLCAYCPTGYSYMEYQLDEKIDEKFTNEKEWIKIIGTLEKGRDENADYEEYYYLRVLSLEIMDKRGQDTVNN